MEVLSRGFVHRGSRDLPEEGHCSPSLDIKALVFTAALTRPLTVAEIYCGIKAGFAVGELSVQVRHETDENNLRGGHVLGGAPADGRRFGCCPTSANIQPPLSMLIC